MDEAHYWLSLEFRVSDELALMSQNHLRYLWCDGFTPSSLPTTFQGFDTVEHLL